MHKYGLKLWSINKNYAREAESLYKKMGFQFIELFVVPGSYEKHIKLWKAMDIPYVLHASTYPNGLNLSKKNNKYKNLKLIKEVKLFADQLNAKIIIVHSGTDGKIEETVTQIKDINDKRIIVENKPYLSLYKNGKKRLICNGNSPEEINYIMKHAKVGFCLDIGHAISSANSHNIDPIDYLKDFIKLKPKMYHLTDGRYNNELDEHFHFGSGNYPIKKILKLLPSSSNITIESKKNSKNNLNDFVEDIKYLKTLT